MPALTTTAGRHAADVARQRAAAIAGHLAEQQDDVREDLAATYRRLGLRCFAHYHPQNAEPSLAVNCRLEHALDHDLVYAVLDEKGWRPDPARLSRVRHGYDVLRLVHENGARLVLVVHIPFPRGRDNWEAA